MSDDTEMPVEWMMKTESEKNEKPEEPAADRKKKNPRSKKNAAADEDFSSELGAPRWSIVSFESRVAGNLTYDEAVRESKKLEAKKISGLCIITDEAAAKIKSQKDKIN